VRLATAGSELEQLATAGSELEQLAVAGTEQPAVRLVAAGAEQPSHLPRRGPRPCTSLTLSSGSWSRCD
jgi:hypothetical protein